MDSFSRKGRYTRNISVCRTTLIVTEKVTATDRDPLRLPSEASQTAN
jgi:hypothetical protein